MGEDGTGLELLLEPEFGEDRDLHLLERVPIRRCMPRANR
jgi:hypothetical protein